VYRLLAPHYDALRPLWASHRLGGAESHLEREVLPRYLSPGGLVLDLGCGTGANLERLLRLGIPFGYYLGVDLSPAMIYRAQRKFSSLSGVGWCLGDVQQLPLAGDSFDFALSTWALEHVPRVNLAVADAYRVLKDSTYLCLLSFSLPRSPWGLLARLVEPALRLSLSMRLVKAGDYSSLPEPRAWAQFAGGLQTLLLLRKEPGR